MRLLIIHQAFVDPDSPGGTRHFELARHLTRFGHEVTIVASDISYLTGTHRSPTGTGEGAEERYAGVRVMRAKTLQALHRSFVWRVLSFSSFMVTSAAKSCGAGQVDVVMGTSPPIFQAVSAWLVAGVRGTPFLLEIRDLWPEFAIDMGVLRNRLLIKLSRWLERFLYARADHLLVNSPAYRDYLMSRGVPADKISLVSNGTDPAMFDPDASGVTFRRKWGGGASFLATYAGALGMANDIPIVLEAARILMGSDIRILLVGDGKERDALERAAGSMGLENVVFTGAIPKSQMGEALAASDACIAILRDIPMFRTTYPNKVFDYMAAGRPVLLAIDGVIREVVESAGAGVFVPPNDPKALAEALVSLAEDPERRRAMGSAGRAAVVSHFNRNSQAEEFRSVVETLGASDKAR